MPTSHSILKDLEQAVIETNPDRVDTLFKSNEIKSISDEELLAALTRGLSASREKLGNASTCVAEFLLSIDAMRKGISYLTDLSSEEKDKRRAVIGVIQGDVHDLGANIIAGVMEALGYNIKNIGIATGPEQFIQALKEFDASILGLSSMMSTTLTDMKETIKKCKQELPEVMIIVGGAALDDDLARSLGAHGYSASAVELPEVLDSIERLIHSDGNKSRKYMDYNRKIQMIETESP